MILTQHVINLWKARLFDVNDFLNNLNEDIEQQKSLDIAKIDSKAMYEKIRQEETTNKIKAWRYLILLECTLFTPYFPFDISSEKEDSAIDKVKKLFDKMSLNKVILIGNVGRDPEVRYFDNNVAVANFPLATSERGYTLANGTVIPERTEWHNIVVRRDLVQFVEKWVKKGSGLYVEGKIRTRTYDDAQGIKRYVTEIYADRVEFYSTGSRPADSTQQSQQQPAATTYAQPAKPAAPAASEPDEPDDLPF